MRVISGIAKGRVLKTTESYDVRPTSDLIKGAVFNAIQFDVEGRRVLDLFAGSGQMGIEALSRGAKSAVFVDSSAESVKYIRQNLKITGFTEQSTIRITDAESFLNSNREIFDIAFLDPPYNKNLLQEALPKLTEFISPYGMIFCEHDKSDLLPESVNDFVKVKQYRHGRILVSLYKRGTE